MYNICKTKLDPPEVIFILSLFFFLFSFQRLGIEGS